jgi:hypothetical protein
VKFLSLLVLALMLSVAHADDNTFSELPPIPVPANLATPVFSPPPDLAFTGEELTAIKAAPNFLELRAAAVKAADALLKNPVPLPEGYAGWIFDYACPDDGSSLHALSLTEHQCPQCKKVYSDQKTSIAYRASLHYAAENAVETLGRAYAFSDDDRYASEVKHILVFLANAYPSYPDRLDRWGNAGDLAPLGGRRFVQSLDEAVGIIKLAKGYDLTRSSSVWTSEDHSLVEKNLFALTAQTLLRFNQDINNHQTWYDAGLMAIASVLDDADLVHRVLTMRGGYFDQLNRSVGRDGIWYEGTMAYQNYALQAVREIVEAARRMGIKLYDDPKFKTLLLGPLHAAYPNGQFPAINDSDISYIGSFQWSFDWAKTLYDKPLDTTLSTTSEDLPDIGLAILRQGTGKNATCTFLDYGQHGGGHGHFDKLNLMLYANGREWLLDPGRLSYSHKEYKTWVKESAAHNTVTWNGTSQRPTKGELLWLRNGDGWSACAAQSRGAYRGVVLRRYLFLTNQILADVYEVEAEEPGQIDWLAHAVVPGMLPVDDVGMSTPQSPGEKAGYQHLSNGKKWMTTAASRWDFLADSKVENGLRLRVWLADNEPEEIFTATGIGYDVSQKAPTLIRRRQARSTRFVTLYDLSGQGSALQDVIVPKTAKDSLLVTTQELQWKIRFDESGLSVRKSKVKGKN